MLRLREAPTDDTPVALAALALALLVGGTAGLGAVVSRLHADSRPLVAGS